MLSSEMELECKLIGDMSFGGSRWSDTVGRNPKVSVRVRSRLVSDSMVNTWTVVCEGRTNTNVSDARSNTATPSFYLIACNCEQRAV